MRILVAEDDPISRRLLKASLNKWGYEVTAVSDGDEAWTILSGEDSPQMAVLDWMMPGMDGVTICKKIRSELPPQPARYVILLTAKGRREDVIAGFDAGADDYVTKPFNAQELKARINVGNRIISLQNTLASHIEKLKELDRLKSEFLATVSHELRTPIAVMREGVSLCVDGVAGELNEMQHEFLSDALDNIDRLSRLIDDLLDISKIEAGKVLVRKSDINICDIVRKTVRNFQPIAEKKGITLELSVPDSGIEIFADKDRIVQVFSNLITNAINFTSEGGYVSVSVRDDENEVICIVKDTGIGIDKENIPKLFNKFQQFGRQEGPGYRGTGLGLAIVKGLVEKHGGRIWAESEKGKGSTFTFTLRKFIEDKVLVVTRDNEAQILYKKLLEEHGHNVEVVNSCEEAVEIAKLNNTSFIIVDICSECGADNFEAANKLLNWPEFKTIPSVVILDKSFEDQKLNIGIKESIKLITKPVDQDYLLEVIEKSLTGEEVLG